MRRACSLLMIVLLSACCPKQPPPAPSASPWPKQGVIWVNQHDLVVSPSARITLGTNGTAVFVNSKPCRLRWRQRRANQPTVFNLPK